MSSERRDLAENRVRPLRTATGWGTSTNGTVMPSWIFAVQHLFQTLLRNLGGLEMSVPAYLLWHSPGDLYIYIVITTAFLEGVIWQISVSAPSARLISVLLLRYNWEPDGLINRSSMRPWDPPIPQGCLDLKHVQRWALNYFWGPRKVDLKLYSKGIFI